MAYGRLPTERSGLAGATQHYRLACRHRPDLMQVAEENGPFLKWHRLVAQAEPHGHMGALPWWAWEAQSGSMRGC